MLQDRKIAFHDAAAAWLESERPGAPALVVLTEALMRPPQGKAPKCAEALAGQLAGAFSVRAVYGLSAPTGTDPISDPGIWARKALQLSAWLDGVDTPEAGSHIVGHGDGNLLACQLALDRPDLVASLTLIAPDGLARGADAAVEMTGTASGSLTVGAAYELALERKRHVRRLLAQLDEPGLRRPVSLIARDDDAAGLAMIDVFDLFARRQYRTELHLLPDVDPAGSPIAFADCLRVLRGFVGSVDRGD